MYLKGGKTMNKVIQARNLSKSFDKEIVLDSINFEAQKGEVMGLLGSNGAGKTTLLKLLCGLLKPDEGEVAIFSKSPFNNKEQVLKSLGIMIETPVFYEHLCAKENLQIHLDYLGVKGDIDDVLKTVGLYNVGNKKVSKFSMGMKQRLGIARAISHSPSILLLDEPINGLDIATTKEIRELFQRLSQNGTTIIISSHILGEILNVTTSLAVIAKGRLETIGTVRDLKNNHGENLENYLIERMRG